MSSPYPILDSRPIDKWRVTELKEELKRRKLTTKGLKEDLLKRLDEAIRTEVVPEGADNGSDVPQSELQSDRDREGSGTADGVIVVPMPKVPVGEGGTKPFVPRTAEASVEFGSNTVGKVDENVAEDIDATRGSLDEGKVAVDEVVNVANSSPTDVPVVEEPSVLVGLREAPMISLNVQDLQHGENHKESGDLKSQLEKDDLSNTQLGDVSLKSPHADNDSIIISTPSMQVSEVSHALELQVKSDSIATDSIPTNEKNKLKDNITADDNKIELDVKPAIIQLSPGPIVPDDDKSHPMDVAEPHENKSFIEENGGKNTEHVEMFKKIDSGDMGSQEKLNLDRSSGDDSMEEDVWESKPIDSMSNFDEMEGKAEKVEAPSAREEGLADVVVNDVPADIKVATIEKEKSPATISAKRKLHEQSAVENNDVKKRQRRWNSEAQNLDVTESASTVDSLTPKDTFHPTLKRSYSKSATSASEPKEGVVPQSSKPPTNSLRIDRFLRPFTLKAVQELLGKTGTVTSFWMDHIKTHCYVSYSSVEEAIETRNAVYNLQWPTNGGHLLIAEFVDPQEVKARVDPPPQSLTTPVRMGPTYPRAQPIGKPLPLTQQQVQRQQLPPPPPPPPLLPPPPPLSNPPLLAGEQPPPAMERLLPPPPTNHEKVDPPIITLDDLFRKTKAAPRIYYLPLSDEQVAAKLRD